MDAEALLGPMPTPWHVEIQSDSMGYRFPRYLNEATNVSTLNDPRLGPLSDVWNQVGHERTRDDPALFQYFQNTVTGEIMNSDPRLLPEALEERGVQLQAFRLV